MGAFKLVSGQIPEIVAHFKIGAKDLTTDEYTILIKDLLFRNQIYDIGCKDTSVNFIDAAVISSVVPNLTDTLYRTAKNLCGKPPFVITSGIRTGFGIQIKNPEQLGTDIVCNVAAALQLTDAPCAVLDMGTATTLTVADSKRNILGTIIIPGMRVSLNALYDSAAQLSDIILDNSFSLIGTDTRSSICSGIINGNAYMLDGFVRNIREELGLTGSTTKLSLIATGGLAEYILPHLRNRFTFVETLTLQGEAILYAKNHKLL
ncbi:MAG: type III pantothenate kinase [Clostridia bacterium]|nr:type III pantothenate kinase [Clostridia bacterium]